MENSQLYAWACSKIRDAVDEKIHGNVIINIRGGEIRSAEIQKHEKPPIDEYK